MSRFTRFARVVFALSVVGGSVVACSGSKAAPPPWKLVWSDEFTEATLDATKWSVDPGDSFGTNQQDYDTADNITISGGYLTITAKQEAMKDAQYTSGRIETANLFSQTYGRFEASMKIPKGQGMWPAFWMLGSDYATNPWPACGEIDIMENAGADTTTVNGSLHGPPSYTLTQGYQSTGGVSLADAFHQFAVEWEPGEIRWYVDGTLYETQDSDLLPRNEGWPFDHSFFLILDLAVGGNYGGPVGATTVFPQSLLVDYVRVYARAGEGDAG